MSPTAHATPGPAKPTPKRSRLPTAGPAVHRASPAAIPVTGRPRRAEMTTTTPTSERRVIGLGGSRGRAANRKRPHAKAQPFEVSSLVCGRPLSCPHGSACAGEAPARHGPSPAARPARASVEARLADGPLAGEVDRLVGARPQGLGGVLEPDLEHERRLHVVGPEAAGEELLHPLAGRGLDAP